MDRCTLIHPTSRVVARSSEGAELKNRLRKSEKLSGERGVWLQPCLNARPRIEIITQRITDKVKRQNSKHHRHRREQNQVWGVEQMRTPVVEHSPPTCGWRRYTESEKAHRRFGENRSGHTDCGLHDHGLNHVRKDVSAENP